MTALTVSAFAQEKLKADGEILIMGHGGVPSELATVERYREYKACGFNLSLAGFPMLKDALQGLDNAQKAGVKLGLNCKELYDEPEKTARILMKHPAFDCYFLMDEPNASAFVEWGERVKKIQSVDKENICYINLLPDHHFPDPKGILGVNSYTEYVDSFIRAVPAQVVSFDHYPVCELPDGKVIIRESFYDNLETVARVSQKYGLPFWAFALSMPHFNYPVPTVEQLRFQQYSNLAYGAQGLQYFSYTPWRSPDNYHDAILGHNHKRTVIYDRVKLVNNEIQALAGVFYGSKLVQVEHTGKNIPVGTRRLAKLPDEIKYLATSEGGAVVSVLERGNRRFLVVVNRDFANPMTLTVVTADKVKRVLKDATLVPASDYMPVMEVDPGDVMIYTWEK